MENLMKKIILKWLGFAALFLSTSMPLFAAETLTIDNQHSYVLWRIQHLGFSTQAGKWYVNGTIAWDEKDIPKSKVDVAIDVENIITGIPELDKHLKSEQFFDTKQFPKATFVSDKIVVTAKNKAKVHGLLTVHGVSKPIVLTVVLNKKGINPIHEQMTYGFSAKTTLKRSDFGLNTLLPKLGDQVLIDIDVEAYQPKGKEDAVEKQS